ncbi:hypothetical protein GCM10009633_27960 [Janibacter melonis]|uniref:hypothetical protein n=1 Tax=Janibacter melonis TaxID=262209 RepID=UPI001E2DF7EA|nr:hypothetical protein [Janibacter melonis]MCB5992812.1 hypothetical protein [Janibacter melonis]
MRWDRLFDDLESQLAAQERLELDSEVAERTRVERSKVTLTDRLVGSTGAVVGAHLLGGRRLEGVLVDVGAGWFVLEARSRPTLVVTGAVVSLSGLARRPRSTASARRLTLGYALRGVSRDRRVVHVHDVGGGLTTGTIDGVGADVVDVGEHPVDVPRRAGDVRSVRVLPLAALAAVADAG